MVAGLCRPLSDRAFERCFHVFPCLADPARRAALGLRVTLVMLHLIYAGIIFLFDGDLINETKTEPWYVEASVGLNSFVIIQRQSASNGNGSLLVTVERESGTNAQGSNAISWTKLVMDMYPRGTTVSFPLLMPEVEGPCGIRVVRAHIVMLNSLHEQSIVMIVRDAFSSLIIIVFG
ncbi:hypothetical protein SLEP1_g51368 [Rubroshorea leprosula]|uniref:Uncharacterized protein n=1 Tax=Rubroshorea leprosula TaxID=152421 RepID=A0AAV5M3R5_9ROSI|nr:hypothetical protein SLEP1_g51368 [Rubroshorea leprosula]